MKGSWFRLLRQLAGINSHRSLKERISEIRDYETKEDNSLPSLFDKMNLLAISILIIK